MNDIILVALLVTNLVVIGLVVFLIKQFKPKPTAIDDDVKSLEQTKNQIEFLQNKFKQSLEEIISKDSLLLEKTSNNIIKYYQDTVTTLTLNYNQNSEKLMNLLAEELKKKTASMDKKIIEQLEVAEKEVSDQVKTDLVEVAKAVERYKEAKFKQIDTQVYQVISETAKNTVGKVINLVDHQQLVMNALDQAKKEKFF